MKIGNINFLYQNKLRKTTQEDTKANAYTLSDCISFSAKVDFIKKIKSIPEESFPSMGLKKYILENTKKGADFNIFDLHKEYYSGLLTCETLDDAKELYPEFNKVVDAKDIDLSKLNHKDIFKKIAKGEIENLSLDNLSLNLLKKVYGELMPTMDDKYTKENFNVRHPILKKMMKILHIEMDKEYAQLIRASRQSKTYNSKWQDDEYRLHQAKMIAEANRDLQKRNKLSDATKKMWLDENYRKQQTESRAILWQDKAYKERMTEKRREYWQSPDSRQKQSETIKKAWENDEIRLKYSNARKEMWEQEEHQALMSIVYKAKALAWNTHPTAREAFKEVAKEYPELGEILNNYNKKELTPRQIRIENSYYKTCAERYPNLAKEIAQIQKDILTSWGFYESNRDIAKILELIENIQ